MDLEALTGKRKWHLEVQCHCLFFLVVFSGFYICSFHLLFKMQVQEIIVGYHLGILMVTINGLYFCIKLIILSKN